MNWAIGKLGTSFVNVSKWLQRPRQSPERGALLSDHSLKDIGLARFDLLYGIIRRDR